MGLDFVIAYNRSWGNFVPNVNVTIEPAQGFSIRGWMENSNPIIRAYGFELTDVQIDDASNTGVRVMRGNYGGMIADQIQRVIISDGQAYIATATRPVGFEADPNLWANLNQILNSFRLG